MSTQQNFKTAIAEAKAQGRKEKKDLIKIKGNDILMQRVFHLYVAGKYTNTQIASMMGVSKRTIDRILKDPDMIDRITEYQNQTGKEVELKLKSIREKALDRLMEIVDDEDSAVALTAIKDVLDRTGHAAKKDNNLNINISYEQKLAELTKSVDLSYIDASYVACDDTTNTSEGAGIGD